MFERLKRLIARLRASRAPMPPPLPPEDPNVGVRQPNWRRPPHGHSAVAVAEPKD
jgi:hypothetical protein